MIVDSINEELERRIKGTINPQNPPEEMVSVHLSTIRRRDEHMLNQKATIDYYHNMGVWERIKFAIHPRSMRR